MYFLENVTPDLKGNIDGNNEEVDARSVYFGFYVKRDEASKNRIFVSNINI
jgi:hypothetical protein